MADIEKVLNGLRHCLPEKEVDRELNCGSCLYHEHCENCDTITIPLEMVEDIFDVLKEQQAEIERLKGELKAECKNAGHDAYGCLGYGKSSQNDELIEKCINCEKYTGNITRAKIN